MSGHYHQKSMPTSGYTKMSPNGHFYGNAHRRHNSLSASGSHLSYGGRQPTRSTSGLVGGNSSTSGLLGVNGRAVVGGKGVHQRSISMDDHDLMSSRRKPISGAGSSASRLHSRGCNLCEDHEDDDFGHQHFSQSNEYLHNSDDHFYYHSNGGIDDIFEEEPIHKTDVYHEDEEETERKHEGDHFEGEEEIFVTTPKNIPQEYSSNSQTDEMVDQIVNKIYEKIHSAGNTPNKNSVGKNSNSDFLKNDNLLISKLLHSMAIEHVENNDQVMANGKCSLVLSSFLLT